MQKIETNMLDVANEGNKTSINKVSYKAKVEGDILSRGIDKIIYSHISHQTRFPKSDVSLIKFNLNIKAKNIAYLMGSGDKVPESLSLVGYNVDLFEKKIAEYTGSKYAIACVWGPPVAWQKGYSYGM